MPSALLQLFACGGRAPRSVVTSCCDLKAWKTNGTVPSSPPQTKKLLLDVVGMDVAEAPAAMPRPLSSGLTLNGGLMKLAGPPKVPMSTSL